MRILLAFILAILVASSQPMDSVPIWIYHTQYAKLYNTFSNYNSSSFFCRYEGADSSNTGYLKLNPSTGDSIGFFTFPIDSVSGFNMSQDNNNFTIEWGGSKDKVSIYSLSSSKLVLDSIPIPKVFDTSISDTSYGHVLNFEMLKNNEIFIQVQHYYPSLNPTVADTYSDLMIYNYNSNTFTWDSTITRECFIQEFDTTGHFLGYIYDNVHTFDEKSVPKYDTKRLNEDLVYYDLRNNNLKIDTVMNEFLLTGSDLITPQYMPLAPNGQNITSTRINTSALFNVIKIGSSTFKNEYLKIDNTIPHYFDNIRSLQINQSSEYILAWCNRSFMGPDSYSCLFDISTGNALKRFKYGVNIYDEIVLDIENRNTIKAYSVTSIPSSVAPPIEEDLFEELLDSKEDLQIYDTNGQKIKVDGANNRQKYQKLQSGRYFIQTENKTYKIMK